MTPIVARGTKALPIDKSGLDQIRPLLGVGSLEKDSDQISRCHTVVGELSESLCCLFLTGIPHLSSLSPRGCVPAASWPGECQLAGDVAPF